MILVSRAARGKPIGRASGVADHTAETLLETLTVNNFSGASRTDPYVTFRRSFAKGAVPSGSFVEARYGGSAIAVQQADGRTLHTDGSLRSATFALKPGTGSVADNGTFDVALYAKSGSFSNSTSIARSTLTAQDYRLEIVIGGTTYYCLLNNLDTAGTYREIRAGSCVRAWHYWGPFRDGTGGAATDQGKLVGHFYAYVWEDVTLTVFGRIVNGRVSNGVTYTVTSCDLKNGGSALKSLGSFTFYAWTAKSLTGTDALPYWSANATDTWANVDATYAYNTKLLPYIHSTSTQRSAIGSGTAANYTAGYDYTGGGSIDQSGASGWIGVVPLESALALLSNNKTRIRNDRVGAFGQEDAHNRWFCKTESGMPPILTDTDYSGSGLTSSEYTRTAYGAGDLTADNGPGWAGHDFSHQPEYSYFQYVTTGWEWHLDACLFRAIGTGISSPAGTPSYERNPIINSVQQFGVIALVGQARHMGWGLRCLSNLAWVRPDNHVAKDYIDEILSVSKAYHEKRFATPFRDTTLDTLGIYETGEGATNSGLYCLAWQHDYIGIVVGLGVEREQWATTDKLVDTHIKKWIIGKSTDGCAYWGIGAQGVAIRVASPAGSLLESGDPYPTAWSQVYIGGDNDTPTVKLVSDSGGSSGSCPASGVNTTTSENYGAGHTHPSITHAMAHACKLAGISGASTLASYLDTYESGLGISESAWNDAPQWRLRSPA